MKLTLKKEKLVSLTGTEMQSVKAGGEKRSDRLNTNCKYSREHNDTTFHEVTGGGCVEITSCVAPNHPSY